MYVEDLAHHGGRKIDNRYLNAVHYPELPFVIQVHKVLRYSPQSGVVECKEHEVKLMAFVIAKVGLCVSKC